MNLFSAIFKKIASSETYDPAKLQPAVRASICTGERVAGFIETGTGKFREVMLLRDDADLRSFRKRYGITDEIKTIY